MALVQQIPATRFIAYVYLCSNLFYTENRVETGNCRRIRVYGKTETREWYVFEIMSFMNGVWKRNIHKKKSSQCGQTCTRQNSVESKRCILTSKIYFFVIKKYIFLFIYWYINVRCMKANFFVGWKKQSSYQYLHLSLKLNKML